MKVLHTTTTTLNTKEFNKLSDKIADSLYALSPEINNIYDIHINYIDESWHIDFLPVDKGIPALKVLGYTEYLNDNTEILKIDPKELSDFPKTLKLGAEARAYDLCMNYVVVFEFIVSLYDFEYEL